MTTANAPQTESFAFSGTAAAYFRIWIVNLCLTIVTLGIYSPWAKVRRNKYLYRNTQLAGGAFDYHADPLAILKGRAIAVVLLGAYVVSAWLQPGLETLVFVLLMLMLPWLLVRSRMFALRNTSYRNIRFSYRPAYREAYKIVLGFYAIGIITLGLALPWARYHRARMLADNSRFGSLDLHMNDEVSAGDFYRIYLGVSLFSLIGFLFLGLLLLPLFGLFGAGGSDQGPAGTGVSLLSFIPLLILAPLYLAIFFALNAAITRVTLNKLRVGEHTIKCGWSLPSLVTIQVSNLLLIFLSLGLLIPWATVRVQRYMLSNLVLEPVGNLDEVLAGEAEDVSALGEEIGEAFDFDFGL